MMIRYIILSLKQQRKHLPLVQHQPVWGGAVGILPSLGEDRTALHREPFGGKAKRLGKGRRKAKYLLPRKTPRSNKESTSSQIMAIHRPTATTRRTGTQTEEPLPPAPPPSSLNTLESYILPQIHFLLYLTTSSSSSHHTPSSPP